MAESVSSLSHESIPPINNTELNVTWPGENPGECPTYLLYNTYRWSGRICGRNRGTAAVCPPGTAGMRRSEINKKKEGIIKHHFVLSVGFIVAKRILYYCNCLLVLPYYMLCFYRH